MAFGVGVIKTKLAILPYDSMRVHVKGLVGTEECKALFAFEENVPKGVV